MEDLIRAASALDHFCQDRGWKYCFIGGLALQYWGLPRLTRDVNLCLLTGFGNEAAFVDPLLGAFASRIAETRQFAMDKRILLLTTLAGIALDISLGGIPYEAKVVERSRSVEFLPSIELRICSAEDLIVLKCFADRLQDWADVENVVRKQKQSLDCPYIDRELAVLCELKEAPEIVEKLHNLRLRLA